MPTPGGRAQTGAWHTTSQHYTTGILPISGIAALTRGDARASANG